MQNPFPSSPFSRISLLAYIAIILYASWFPFTGWQANSLSALPDVIRQWPRYWTIFDAITNVIGYIPLGILLVFSVYPHLRRWKAFIFASLCGALLSATAELVQFFLPSRVTSLLDFLTNSAGSVIGAVIGVWLTVPLLEKGRLRLLRREWALPGSSRDLVLIGLWPLAQISPQAYLFGLGGWLAVISQHVSDWLEMDIDLSVWLLHGIDLSADDYLLAETLITASGATAALMFCLSVLTKRAPKSAIATLLLATGLAAKSIAAVLFFGQDAAFSWLTPGARGGLLIALLMLYGFSFAPLVVQQRLTFLLLSINLLILNMLPDNPYFSVTLQSWEPGKFLNFNGAAVALSLFWPVLALWAVLTRPRIRQRDEVS